MYRPSQTPRLAMSTERIMGENKLAHLIQEIGPEGPNFA
jgi:hypothetical protein